MDKIKIISDNSKFDIVKTLPYNCIYNRFDIVWLDVFNLIEIINGKEVFYIPYHIEKFKMYLSLFMLNISDDIFNNVIDFIKNTYNHIISIEIWHALNKYEGLRKTSNSILYLPQVIDDYYKQFTSKTLYNRRYAKQKLIKNFKVEFKYFKRKDFTDKLLKTFLNLKNNENALLGNSVYYSKDYKCLLGNIYYLTDIWTLYINDKIAAIILYSSTDGINYWCENMAYDIEYKNYGIGNILYYYSIEEIIKRSGKTIILGGGHYDYKTNSKAVTIDTYTGIIYIKQNSIINFLYKIFTKLFSVQTETDRYYNKKYKIIRIFGFKLKI